jgi:hypothetical protein
MKDEQITRRLEAALKGRVEFQELNAIEPTSELLG